MAGGEGVLFFADAARGGRCFWLLLRGREFFCCWLGVLPHLQTQCTYDYVCITFIWTLFLLAG